jgi:hypothetical protein
MRLTLLGKLGCIPINLSRQQRLSCKSLDGYSSVEKHNS